jgi:hypothetical protein
MVVGQSEGVVTLPVGITMARSSAMTIRRTVTGTMGDDHQTVA